MIPGENAARKAVERAALVDLALELDAEAAAVLMDRFARDGRLSEEVARRCVAETWDLCPSPMAVLAADRWAELFRTAGYTHEYVPAPAPAETLRLYRGSDAAGEFGMCWSSNPDVARWFAIRYDEGWVWAADVAPWRLLAFMAAVYEDQYVVDTAGLYTEVMEDPAAVRALDIEALTDRLDALAAEAELP